MVVLDSTVVNIALPSAQADLGFTNAERQWIITAYSLAFGSLLLLGGRLSDLIGRKRTFIIGLIGFAAASALGGAANSFGMLVGARAIQGAFGALLAPTALAVLTTTFTIPKERARAFGVFGAIAGAGGAIGLLLGGVLTEYFSWRWSLYINVVIALVAIVGAIFFVTSVKRSGPRPKLDIPGTVLVSGALFSLVYGFSNAETDGWDSPLTWGFLVAAGVLLIAFVLWQRRAAHPLLPLSIVLNRNRGAAFISVLIAGAGMFGIFLFVTYYMQETLHYSPIQTGLAFLPMIGMLVLSAQLSTNIFLPRLGPEGHGAVRNDPRYDRDALPHASRPAQFLRRRHPAAAADPRIRDGLDHAGVDPDGHPRCGPLVRRRRLRDGQHRASRSAAPWEPRCSTPWQRPRRPVTSHRTSRPPRRYCRARPCTAIRSPTCGVRCSSQSARSTPRCCSVVVAPRPCRSPRSRQRN